MLQSCHSLHEENEREESENKTRLAFASRDKWFSAKIITIFPLHFTSIREAGYFRQTV
jgi:hypothetical protein